MIQDSFEKYAHSFWEARLYSELDNSRLLQHVNPKDRMEIAIAFSIEVSHLEYADNFRIFPMSMTKEYWAAEQRGCCGSWNSQVKTKSGRLYWLGCNYGH